MDRAHVPNWTARVNQPSGCLPCLVDAKSLGCCQDRILDVLGNVRVDDYSVQWERLPNPVFPVNASPCCRTLKITKPSNHSESGLMVLLAVCVSRNVSHRLT